MSRHGKRGGERLGKADPSGTGWQERSWQESWKHMCDSAGTSPGSWAPVSLTEGDAT